MKRLKIGVIGAGRIGSLHAKSIARGAPGARVTAIADVRADNAERIAAELEIPKVYRDHRELLADPEIEAVLVCSSTDSHAKIAIEAARAGKHIFCEKPVDLTPQKVISVMEAVKKAGVKFQVGFNRRFDHNFARIKSLIDAGRLGDVHIVKITSRDPAPPPPEYSAVSGGMFIDMTIHDFDMARFLTGSEPAKVYASAARLIDPAIAETGDVDTAIITVEFESGALCVIDNSRRAVYGYDQRVEVFGSKGTAAAANDAPTNVVLWNDEGLTADKPLYFFLERYMQSFRDEIVQFVEAVVEDKPTPTSGEDGLYSIVTALAAKKSFAENRPVKISEIL